MIISDLKFDVFDSSRQLRGSLQYLPIISQFLQRYINYTIVNRFHIISYLIKLILS